MSRAAPEYDLQLVLDVVRVVLADLVAARVAPRDAFAVGGPHGGIFRRVFQIANAQVGRLELGEGLVSVRSCLGDLGAQLGGPHPLVMDAEAVELPAQS